MRDPYFVPVVTIGISILLGSFFVFTGFMSYLYGNINSEYGSQDIRLKRAWIITIVSLILLTVCVLAFIGSLAVIAYMQC